MIMMSNTVFYSPLCVSLYSLIPKIYGLIWIDEKNQTFISNIEDAILNLVNSWRPFLILRFKKSSKVKNAHQILHDML